MVVRLAANALGLAVVVLLVQTAQAGLGLLQFGLQDGACVTVPLLLQGLRHARRGVACQLRPWRRLLRTIGCRAASR